MYVYLRVNLTNPYSNLFEAKIEQKLINAKLWDNVRQLLVSQVDSIFQMFWGKKTEKEGLCSQNWIMEVKILAFNMLIKAENKDVPSFK